MKKSEKIICQNQFLCDTLSDDKISQIKTMAKQKFLFGTDPEFALQDSENRIVSAIPILEQDKHNPIDLGDGHKIYFDNVLAEANIAPASSKSDLKNKLKALYKKSQSVLKNHRLSAVASHEFEIMECLHPEAQKFGCDPELDAYAGGPAYPPRGGHQFRSAGGHIHIGGIDQNKTVEEKVPLVFLMDILVGIPSVLMDNDPTSLARKRLYGKAGRFRNTSYGLEYRTLGNFWLSSPIITEIIYDLTMLSANLWANNKQNEVFTCIQNSDDVISAINEHNKDLARSIFEKLPIPNNLKSKVLDIAGQEYNSNIFDNWKI